MSQSVTLSCSALYSNLISSLAASIIIIIYIDNCRKKCEYSFPRFLFLKTFFVNLCISWNIVKVCNYFAQKSANSFLTFYSNKSIVKSYKNHSSLYVGFMLKTLEEKEFILKYFENHVSPVKVTRVRCYH